MSSRRIAKTAELHALDVSRQRVHQLATSHPRFPEPYARLATGPIWTLPAIEHFRDTWDPQARPPSSRSCW